ncbi:succinylglutamate desuccinylase/aspartoacylase family protein [Salinirubellus sp. GCM10025818]|uniref:succinylglutamate desuccinylase/aspartoacylase family protein n=1 Tax=Salinirubellus TaxID=2162630 RepID=UPI0030D1919E
MSDQQSEPFTFDGGQVEPGEIEKLRYAVSETYLGDPVRIPVTIINGSRPGQTALLSAAVHGDELNGIEVFREVAQEWDHTDVCGTIVCLPVLNVQGFTAQERYLPIYDRDLNRSFPGKRNSTSSNRTAHRIYQNFIAPCDFGLDFHISTRGRTNVFHVRADMDDKDAARLARAFGTNLIIAGEGSSGTLRREATEDGVPVITLEMGEAHRFERELIDHALEGVRSVFAEYGIYQQETVRWPGWRTIIDGWGEKTWLRADVGGLVEMNYERGDLVHEGETIFQITNPFKSEATVVEAPCTGLLVGVLENPVVYPGNPLCPFVKIGTVQERIIEAKAGRTHG